MKPFLMHPDLDLDLTEKLPRNESGLVKDLELDTLLSSMAGGDEFLAEVAKKVLLLGLHNDVATILYRQEILKDCLENPTAVRTLYELTVTTIKEEKKHWWLGLSKDPGGILYEAVSLLQMFTGMLRKLKDLAQENSSHFKSDGFRTLFTTLQGELSEEYLASIQGHLSELQFEHGALLSAELGDHNQGTNYVLRQRPGGKQGWLERLFDKGPPAFTFRLAERDEAGMRILSDLRGQGISQVANALAQSSDHILSFFDILRAELGFYIACLNLHDQLAGKGQPTCFPVPKQPSDRTLHFSGLYDVSLVLSMDRNVVGNSVNADGKSLVIITGANQGGKSSFLRSMGLAQVLMQSGSFVGAEELSAGICTGLFTHYKREEDSTMMHGKFDEELARMSEIASQVKPDALILFNESFAATNEREGSEIARQIVCALLEKRIKIFFVTHLYELSNGFYRQQSEGSIFLRAERKEDGTRTFRLIEGEPLATSFGEDLYREIFDVGA